MENLELFWKQGDCSLKTKLNVYTAVIRAKLLYGLESAQLNPTNLRRIATFQLKGIRQIMKIQTTYMNRENTNEYVFQEANKQTKKNNIQPFGTYYKERRKH